MWSVQVVLTDSRSRPYVNYEAKNAAFMRSTHIAISQLFCHGITDLRLDPNH